jgi:drug/metabolite transporter (DMT)-like permease
MKIERSHLMFGLMCLIWGATWIAVKVGIVAVPPVFFAGTRFVVAGALLLLYVWLRNEPLRICPPDLPRLAAVTLLMAVATYALLFWGAQFVSSGLTAILAFMPVALLSIGVVLREDRFRIAWVI